MSLSTSPPITTSSSPQRFHWVRAAWLVSIAIFLFCARFPWTLEEYDQAKQSFVSLEIIQDGSWISQHTPVGNPARKPPLQGWISAALFPLTQNWELAWRLPSYFSALILLYLVGRLGQSFGGEAGRYVAESFFAFNMLTPRMATLIRTEMLLTVLICGIVFTLLKPASEQRGLNKAEGWSVALLCAAANLTKGPLLYAFVLPGLLAHTIWRRHPKLLLHFLLASLPGVALLLGWTALAASLNPAFYDHVVAHEFLSRFQASGEAPHKAQPFYFYVPHLLAKLIPWSLAFLLILKVPQARRALTLPAPRFLLLTAGMALLVMSIFPSKRVDRIYPIVPLLAVAAAAAAPMVSRRWVNSSIILAAAGWISYTAITGSASYRAGDAWLAQFGARVLNETAQRQWTTGLVRTSEEGIYSYLRVTSAISPNEAIKALHSGSLNAVVAEKKHRERIATGLLKISGGDLTAAELLAASPPDSKPSPGFLWLYAAPAR